MQFMKQPKEKKTVWVDLTNAPHVLVLKPIIEALKKDGHEVVITARDFSQTISLLKRFNMDFTEIGTHQGKSILKKFLGLFARTSNLIKFAKKNGYKFDLALSHASNDLAAASFIMRIPHVSMFDYEYAKASHHMNFRLSRKVMCPDVIDKSVLRQYSRRDKLDQYEGLKEEYYLHGWEPQESILNELNLDKDRIISVVRTPPDLALYHRFENDLFDDVIRRLDQEDVQVVVLPRTVAQTEAINGMGFKNVSIPKNAVDAQSLIYFADIVISAGGTMNREAVVLNTPVYTLFSGKMGAVDIDLIARQKLFKLESADQLILTKKSEKMLSDLNFRDPRVLVSKILEAAK